MKTTATRFIRDEHKTMRGLFRQFEAVDLWTKEMKDGVVAQIFMQIEVHSLLEEEYFYPAFLNALPNGEEGEQSEMRSVIQDAINEHVAVESLIEKLKNTSADQEQFNSDMVELIGACEAHMKKEEEQILPMAEQIMGPSLTELAVAMRRRREDLVMHPRYRSAQPERTQAPHGGEQMRKKAA